MSHPVRRVEDDQVEVERSRDRRSPSERPSGFAPACRRSESGGAASASGTLYYWPLVLVELRENLDDEGVDRVIETMEAAYARKETFIVIVDASALSRPPNTTQRQRLAAYGAANEHRSIRYAEGTAYAITSGLVRGALTAMQWIFRPPTASMNLKSRHEAVDWCVNTLEGAGVDAKRVGYELLRDTNLGREFGEGAG